MDPRTVKAIIAIVAIVIGAILAIHDLYYLTDSQGVCAVKNQPDILLGASPTMVTAFQCSGN